MNKQIKKETTWNVYTVNTKSIALKSYIHFRKLM